ncbi:MAG TPA: D-alanyl-lipoteichoic acid biosynthesis protein DltD [Drouetiella sp.]|jgi:DltD protein
MEARPQRSKAALSSAICATTIALLAYVGCFMKVQSGPLSTKLDSAGFPKWLITDTQNIPKILDRKRSPDGLLMGSSLVLSPAYKLNARHSDFSLGFLEKELRDRLGTAVGVSNAGVAFAMASDQSRLLDALLSRNIKPKFVVYGLAPRDFVDNSASVDNSPTRVTLDALDPHSGQFFPRSLRLPAFENAVNAHRLVLRAISHAGRKTLVRTLRPIFKDTSVADAAPVHSKAERVAFDLNVYPKRYNPPNQDRLQAQLRSFEHMLQACQANQITVLLVNMPLTQKNVDMIDPELLASYEHGVTSMAERYGAEYVDLESDPTYDKPEYFDDTVHLSASGGRKFFDDLSEIIFQDNAIVRKLSSNSAHQMQNGRSVI